MSNSASRQNKLAEPVPISPTSKQDQGRTDNPLTATLELKREGTIPGEQDDSNHDERKKVFDSDSYSESSSEESTDSTTDETESSEKSCEPVARGISYVLISKQHPVYAQPQSTSSNQSDARRKAQAAEFLYYIKNRKTADSSQPDEKKPA